MGKKCKICKTGDKMPKVLLFFVCAIFFTGASFAAGDAFTSCGPGYVLASHANVDGINAAQCKKLWCRDLETGASMGNANGTAAASGYADRGLTELCDANNNCVECFGDRVWCSGEPVGLWNPEYGAYTRGGEDNATYQSYKRGSCFGWHLEKPDCPDGEAAIIQNGRYVCVTSSGNTTASRASSVRRTGTTRRVLR